MSGTMQRSMHVLRSLSLSLPSLLTKILMRLPCAFNSNYHKNSHQKRRLTNPKYVDFFMTHPSKFLTIPVSPKPVLVKALFQSCIYPILPNPFYDLKCFVLMCYSKRDNAILSSFIVWIFCFRLVLLQFLSFLLTHQYLKWYHKINLLNLNFVYAVWYRN